MEDTIFHKIIRREIPAELVHEDEHCVAIKDIHPVSPTHFLVIPKRSVASLAEAGTEHKELLGHLMLVARNLAEKHNLSKEGYRVVINSGENGGQTVFQLHVHVLGGRLFGWPPG